MQLWPVCYTEVVRIEFGKGQPFLFIVFKNIMFLSIQESTECESGCMCPAGLFEDGKGSCVKENDCPCQHNGHLYAPGKVIRNHCNNWYDPFFYWKYNIAW